MAKKKDSNTEPSQNLRQLPVEVEAKAWGEVAIYNPDDSIRLEVRLENETVWLNRAQISLLFDRDVKTIGKHINSALAEELKGVPTVAKFATLQQEGDRWVRRPKEYYNLDMILSVGYRVKSSRGIAFRRWANTVLKEYLLRGSVRDQRIGKLEKRMTDAERSIDSIIYTLMPPLKENRAPIGFRQAAKTSQSA